MSVREEVTRAVSAAIHNPMAYREAKENVFDLYTRLALDALGPFMDELQQARAAEVRQCADVMYRDAYHAINKLMDKAHGPNESDGAGAGLLEDVALVVAQRDDARAKLAACIAGQYKLQFGPAGVPSQQCVWGCGCRPCGDSRDAATRHHEKLAATATDTEDPGTLTGGQLCGGSGQLFKRPCPGCPDCAARAQAAVQRMAEELDMPDLAELPETDGHYGDWLGRPGQCDVWWDARVSKFVDWPRHLKEGAPRIRGIMRCVMALGHEPLPGVESGHNFGGLGPYTPGMPATQLQPDGTYEPVPAGPPLPRCPHCLQLAEPGHEERCQP